MNYDEALKQALAAAGSQTAQQGIAANITEGNNSYNQLVSQQATNNKLEQQRLAQRMANMGIAAPSSLTIENNTMMSGRNDIGDIQRQNQAYTGVQNAMIDQTDANAAAQSAEITANMNAAQNASILDEQRSKMERYYNLYANKKMTANQFKKLTGINAKAWGAAREPLNPDDLFPMTTSEATESARNKGWSLGR
jgi:hypothetical protein